MGIRASVHCSWCGHHYSYRYGIDGNNVFVLTWDLLTFFWFWWHPHFCSERCKLAYKKNKGEIGIQRDITNIKSAISFFKGSKSSNVDNQNPVEPPPPVRQEQAIIKESPAKEHSSSDDEDDDEEDDDEMKYRVFNYGSGTIPLPSLNPYEIEEFQLYIQKAIAECDLHGLKSCVVLNLGPSDEISALEAEYVPNKKIEKLIFFLDVSPHETRDYGVALTNIGILYKFYGKRKGMTWKQLAEGYAIRKDTYVEIVEPNRVMDEDADPVIEINLSQSDGAMIAGEWLFDIICKGCEIFTGKKGTSQNAVSEEIKEQKVPEVDETKKEPAQIVQPKKESIYIEGKSKDRFYYLNEGDRIYIAKKFKERKGFFRHILPASWILTFGFYPLIAFIVLIIAVMAIPDGNAALDIIFGLLIFIIPIVSLVFGIKKRVKYIKEKKRWKECTGSGKRDINDVFKEFQEMENEYRSS